MSMAINIDDDMEVLTEQIEALRQLEAERRVESVSEARRYDFSIRWGTALAGRLRRLVHYSSRGMLTDADDRRYQTLCSELRNLSDLIDRFDLAQPVFIDAPPRRARPYREPRQSNSRRALLRRG
jgi:hypothetical protein